VGCGNGDMLRTLADYGLQHNIKSIWSVLMQTTLRWNMLLICQRCIQISVSLWRYIW
jgi:hypothetical protein